MQSKLAQAIDRNEGPIIGLIALGLFISVTFLAMPILWSAQGAEQLNERSARGHAAYYAHEARGHAERECGKLTPAAKHDCQESIYERAREEQRREYEIEADRNSAVWNEAMGKAAIYGGIGVVVTIILAFFSFIAQTQANERAAIEFRAGRKDAAESAKASDRSYRAFLAAEDANLFVEFFNGQLMETTIASLEIAYFFSARITNIGRSSAILHGWSVGEERGSLDRTLQQNESHIVADRIMLDSPKPFKFIITYSTPIRPRAKLIVETNMIVEKAARKVRASVESHRIEEEE